MRIAGWELKQFLEKEQAGISGELVVLSPEGVVASTDSLTLQPFAVMPLDRLYQSQSQRVPRAPRISRENERADGRGSRLE